MIEAAKGIVTTRTTDKNGQIQVESKHMELPNDLANGFVGTVLLNVPHNTAPFRVGMLAPIGGGQLVQLLIAPESDQTVQLAGQTFNAAVFRIHPAQLTVTLPLCEAEKLEDAIPFALAHG